jgi:hypothetical protein
MKNAGTPEIDEDSDNGSAGVSAEGFGARLPRCGAFVEPSPVERPASFEPLACAWLCVCLPASGELAEELPCALCALTCGVLGAGVVVAGSTGAGAGAASLAADVVGAAVVVLGVGTGVGVELVASGAVVVSTVDVVVASSLASELDGASSASSNAPTISIRSFCE